MDELSTYVLYDIPDDGLRTRVSETCKDYGLERVQFSAFLGPLTRNKREELFLRLSDELGGQAGKILVQPVCEKDRRQGQFLANEEPESDEPEGTDGAADVDAAGQ